MGLCRDHGNKMLSTLWIFKNGFLKKEVMSEFINPLCLILSTHPVIQKSTTGHVRK